MCSVALVQLSDMEVAILEPANEEEIIIPGDPAGDIQAIKPLQLLDAQGNRISFMVHRSDIWGKEFFAIIREDFQVALDFEFLSPAVQELLGALSYTVTYYLDPPGPRLGSVLGVVAKQTLKGETRYNATMPRDGETVLRIALEDLDPGFYRIDGIARFNHVQSGQTTDKYPMHAWVEGPSILVDKE